MNHESIYGNSPLPPNAKLRYGANLPHLTCDNGLYSVTFRLADSLPQSVIAVWKQQRDKMIAEAAALHHENVKEQSEKLARLFSERVETYLDAGAGECHMNNPVIADLVENALKHFDKLRYELLCWCIMPNHVHVIVQPLHGYELTTIVHSWKSFPAHKANKLLNRTGAFWQPEPYDHLIRDEDDLEHAIQYIVANPESAGLRDWRWVGVRPDIANVLHLGGDATSIDHLASVSEEDSGASLRRHPR